MSAPVEESARSLLPIHDVHRYPFLDQDVGYDHNKLWLEDNSQHVFGVRHFPKRAVGTWVLDGVPMIMKIGNEGEPTPQSALVTVSAPGSWVSFSLEMQSRLCSTTDGHRLGKGTAGGSIRSFL